MVNKILGKNQKHDISLMLDSEIIAEEQRLANIFAEFFNNNVN